MTLSFHSMSKTPTNTYV